jgi:hypothetical protein
MTLTNSSGDNNLLKEKTMKSLFLKFFTLALVFGSSLNSCSVFAATNGLDTARIEKLTGMTGQYNEKEKVFKLSYPRTDLHVVASGVHLNPALGLTAWAAFTPVGKHVSVMGDIVLTEDQVNDVMSAALDQGLEVTALHNHFFTESPKIMFMHVGGMGDIEQISNAVKAVFDTLKATTGGKGKFPTAEIDPAKTNLNPKLIDDILKNPGEMKSGVYKVTFGRKTKMAGHEMGSAMGVNTWAAFAGSDQQAVVDGDFAMLETELQDVLKALRKAHINVVAIHNHMTTENPRIMFLHFWGIGSTVDLAKGLQAALATQKP